MDSDGVAALWGRPTTRSHLFNFHPEQDENKSMQVKDRSSSVITIRAAVLREPGRPLRIEKLEMEGPREDEVLVRLVASGICHTDIDFCDSGGVGPAVLGHEGAGVVERLGKSVKGVRVGDHVVLSYQSCGQCRACRGDQPADCQRFYEANFGFQRLDGSKALESSGVRGHFFGQSSFATHTLATMRNLVKVPRTLPLELLAPLGCGLQTGAGTVMNSLAVKAGSSIAVFGAGAVGLAAVMAARIVGARTIIAVDIKPLRLKLALQLGATHTINNRRGDLAQSLSDM
jgi:aryl-alcohol dehydrogenase